MEFKNIFHETKVSKVPKKTVIGIDIGSRQSKAVLLHENRIYTALIPTGFFMKQTADELLDLLFEESKLNINDITYIVSTGYGRIALEFEKVPNRIVTEISCHGLGAFYIGENINTIIDIGGQDSKVIKISPTDGKVVDFAMNDKCAAGTGRFLEKIADVLGYDVTQIGEISLQSEKPTNISSQCIVFAESEVISNRAKGASVSDLAAGVHLSVAKRVNGLLNRVGIEPGVLFTGGVAKNAGVKKAFEDIIGYPLQTTKLDTVYAGALGAALYAGQYAERLNGNDIEIEEEAPVDIESLLDAVAANKEAFIKKSTGKEKNVAYLCAYTPIEILASADVAHMRILHAGNQDEIIAGEVLTQSVFCDFTKSVLGGFEEGNTLFQAIDKVYSFYTCDCMRKTVEAVDKNYVSATTYNLPRLTTKQSSKNYFLTEVTSFRKNLETLTGKKIEDETIRKNIGLYNQAKRYIREISDFRKYDNPLITGAQFQQIAFSYYYLPIEQLLVELLKILIQLKSRKPDTGNKKVRLMLSGGIVADGDSKVTKIVEEGLGARIVVEDNCSGLKPFLHDLKENSENVLTDIVDGYLGQAPCARMKPVEEMIQNSIELAKEYKVDGIIFRYIKFCPCYSIIIRSYLDKFQELNIPVLVIPGDYALGDEGQLKTRIDAFIEVLNERSN